MKKQIAMIAIIYLLIGFIPLKAESQQVSHLDDVTYTIEQKESKHQIDKTIGYYHLLVNKDSKEQLEIMVHNNGAKTSSFQITKNIAKTNRVGTITYSDDKSKGPNSTLEYNLEDFLNIKEDQMTLESGETGTFLINLDMGGKEFDGTLVGAFRVEETSEINQESGIGNRYAYELGIVLTQNEFHGLPSSKTLELQKPVLSLLNGHKKLLLEIYNMEPNFARGLNINMVVVNLDNNKTIFNEKVEEYSIAPNGILPLDLDWDKKDVVPGNYILRVDAEDENETWSWEKEFTIAENEAKEVNENATNKVTYPEFTFLIFIVLSALTIINTYILTKRNFNQSKK